MPPALVGMGVASAQADEVSVAMSVAFTLGAIGALIALALGFSTLR